MIGEFNEESPVVYKKQLQGKDGFESAKKFLDEHKENLDALIQKHKIDELFITQNDFNDKLQKILEYRSQQQSTTNIKYIIVNLTWNSNNWQGISEDKSGHKWVNQGNHYAKFRKPGRT